MFKSKVHFWTLQILMVVLIIFISTKISFLFRPIGIFVSTLFFPILISGILYFLLNPIVEFLQKRRLSKNLSILVVFIALISVIGLAFTLVVPVLTNQISDLVSSIPGYINRLSAFLQELSNSKVLADLIEQNKDAINQFLDYIVSLISTLPAKFSAGLTNIIGLVTNVVLLIATVPFILFYMLKDGYKFPYSICKLVPTRYREQGLTIIRDMNKTVASYIQGQLIVAMIIGALSLTGFIIFKLPYALLLGIIAGVTNIIPYLGPFIGAAPAVVVALFVSPTTALFVIIWIIIAQQVESNLISPLIIGKSLNTHPLTIIFVLLVAGNLAGILGMVIGVPVYAVAKTVVVHIAKLIKLRQSNKVVQEL